MRVLIYKTLTPAIHAIDAHRPAEPYLEAIYLVAPTNFAVGAIGADFTRQPVRYAAAHVFFLPGLTDQIMHKLRNSRAGPYLRRVDTAYIDFIPVESQVFSLDDPFAIEEFYSRACHDLVQKQVDKVARQLVSVCTTLGEYPVIRFYKPARGAYEASILPYMIASALQDKLDAYARDNSDFPPPNEGRGRSTLLVLDRNVDPYAPVLHEFTYQAMAYDLLPIKDGHKFVYTVDKPGGGKEEVEGVISEKDLDWVALRHTHMQEVTEQLAAKMNQLKKENPHFADTKLDARVSDLQNMVASLPGFLETKDRFALNLQMATECMDLLQKLDLTTLADAEQTAALGVTADGRKPKSLSDDVVELLASDNITNFEKVRLLIVYALFRGGLVEADWKKLQQHAKLHDLDLEVIRNMEIFGHRTVRPSLKDKGHHTGAAGGASSTKKAKALQYWGHSEEETFSVSRFVPAVKNIVDQLIRGVLDVELFPFTKDEPVAPDEVDVHSSLRNPRQRAAWAKSAGFQAAKQRVFVFMVGGATQSEVRSAYELGAKYPKEIVIGGNYILTPKIFLRALSQMNVPRAQLRLPIDAPEKRVPDHLFESDRQARQAGPQQQPLQAQARAATQATPTTVTPSAAQNTASKASSTFKEKEKKKGRFGKFFS